MWSQCLAKWPHCLERYLYILPNLGGRRYLLSSLLGKRQTAASYYSWQLHSIKLPQTINYRKLNHGFLGNIRWGSCEPLITFSSTCQYITLLYLCFFKDTIFNISVFMNIKRMANSTVIHGQSSSNTCTFCVGHIMAFLHLGTLDSSWALHFNIIFNTNHPKGHKNMSVNKPGKRYLFAVWVKRERRKEKKKI